MKKEWNTPEIEEVKLKDTAHHHGHGGHGGHGFPGFPGCPGGDWPDFDYGNKGASE